MNPVYDKDGKMIMMLNDNKIESKPDEKQEKFKNILLQIKDLFEDLKVTRSDSVKKFIFDNIYKNLSIIESSHIQLLNDNNQIEKTLSKLESQLQRETAQHKWEIEMIQKFASEDQQAFIDNYIASEEDKILAPYVPRLFNEINLSVPAEEMSAYQCYLNGPDIYSMANVVELSCGYGKLIIDPDKEAIWKKTQEELRIEQEAAKKKQELANKIKQEAEDEDMRDAQQIANEASSFLDAIGPAPKAQLEPENKSKLIVPPR